MAKVSDNKPAKLISKVEPPAFINIPMPGPLNVSSGDTRENFECFEFAWHNYSIASGLDAKPEPVQLCQLVCALGEDAQRLLLQLALSDEQRCTIAGTLDGLRKRLGGSGNMRLDRFEFNRALQRPDETYADYFARLRVLMRRCQFGSTAVEEDFLLDRLLISIRDKWLSRRMACERSLSLDQAIAWCLRNEKQRRDRQNSAAAAAPELDSDLMSTQMPLSAKPTRTSVAASTKARAAAVTVTAPTAPIPASMSTKTTAFSAAAGVPQNNKTNASVDFDRIAPPSYETTLAADAADEKQRRVHAATVGVNSFNEAEMQQRQVNIDRHRAALLQKQMDDLELTREIEHATENRVEAELSKKKRDEQRRQEFERRREAELQAELRESVDGIFRNRVEAQRQKYLETKKKPDKKDKCSLM